LYKLAELTQIAIKKRAEQHHWSLTTYPGKIKLPKDIFHNLENNQAVLEASRKTYLTESEAGWARESGRKTNAVAGPSVSVDERLSGARLMLDL
jgi:sister-chromatid-cohesion protein PDS5